MLAAVALDVPDHADVRNPERIRNLSSAFLKAIHERDDFTCRCCGHRSRKYQEAVLLNPNWREQRSYATVCPFCFGTLHLDAISSRRSGVLIEFPHLSQAELNRLMVEVYMARITMGEGQRAMKCLDALMRCRGAATAAIGNDSPAALAVLIRDQVAIIGSECKLGIRVLPLDRLIRSTDDGVEYNSFPQILAHWRSELRPHEGTSASFPKLEAFCESHL